MKQTVNRRDFIVKSSLFGITCCGLMIQSDLFASKKLKSFFPENEIPEPKKLDYCGYICPPDCKFLTATVKNDVELKKDAYKTWKLKEKYGIAFEPDKIYCWGCKTPDKPIGISVQKCTVRNCAISKSYDCCIECAELPDCKKELWDNFPDFKKTVLEMQKKYLASKTKG